MNKRDVLNAIIAQLRNGLELYEKAARAAHAEATHEQSRAENKYDTRGLEASYLARGQSKHAAETLQALEEFEALLATGEVPIGSSVEVGALIELRSRRERAHYFLGPRAGGTEVVVDGCEVLVITPQSPLGQQLAGKKAGDKVKVDPAGAANEWRIVSVV